MDSFSYYEYEAQMNANKNVEETKRPRATNATVQKLDTVFDSYKKSLNEISIEDINDAANNIEKTTNHSREEILSAMQKATQFGNMNSLKTIGKALNDNNVGMVVKNDNPKVNFNINGVINYFFNAKHLQDLNGKEYGIILDNNKLAQIENFAENKPELFKQKNKQIKYFVLSGFSDGINFINRSKNLEATTRAFLKKDPDQKTIDRAHKLGIEPIIIKNDNQPSIENIYNQLRPEQMTRKQLDAIIDATVMTKFCDKKKQEKTQYELAQYLESNLDVYTPERLSKLSKSMYNKIEQEMETKGKTMEDVLYLLGNGNKSIQAITYQYQQVNNIPRKQFITTNDLLNESITKDKTIVLLDDCSISGRALQENISILNLYTQNNVIYGIMDVSEQAQRKFNTELEKYHSQDKYKIITPNKRNNSWESDNNSVYIALGDSGFEQEYFCTVFPYMAPDNNTEFASNIALFHHINYDKFEDNPTQNYSSIKTFNPPARDIAKQANKLLKDEIK